MSRLLKADIEWREKQEEWLSSTSVIDLAIHMIGYHPSDLENNFESALEYDYDIDTINKLILILNSRWGMEMRLLEEEEE